MWLYAARRVVLAVPLLIGITCISFVVLHLAPGEPVDTQMGELGVKASAQAKQALRELYGLDKPLYQQYGTWLARIARLDFGRSFAPDAKPVLQKIGERLPITIFLNVVEMLVIITLAVPVGILSATHQYSGFDKLLTVFVFVGFATPDFWLALLLMIFFGVQLRWLPISGLRSLNWEYLWTWRQQLDFLSHLVLPISLASCGGLAGSSRYMRQAIVESRERRVAALRAAIIAQPSRSRRRRGRRVPLTDCWLAAVAVAVGPKPPRHAANARRALARAPARHGFARTGRARADALRLARVARRWLRLGRHRDAGRGPPGRLGRLPRGLPGRADHAAGGPDAGVPPVLPLAGGAGIPPPVDLDDHGRDRPHGVDGRGAPGAGGVPDPPGARVRGLVAVDRRERVPHHLAAHSAQRDGAGAGGDDA